MGLIASAWNWLTGRGQPARYDRRDEPRAKPGDVIKDEHNPFGNQLIPHVLQFSALIRAGQKAYLHERFDEALRENRFNALAMRRDAFLMALMNERIDSLKHLKWQLKVPNEQDQTQAAVRDHLTKAVKEIPEFDRLMEEQAWGIWYGRMGSQLVPEWSQIDGHKTLTIAEHWPINGDKIGHLLDHTPYVLINPAESDTIEGAEYTLTDTGGRGLILDGPWRERVLIHRHFRTDADFWEPDRAEAIHGTGVRDVLQWINWLRLEWLSRIAEFMDRVGMGLTIWYVPAHDDAARKEAERAAKDQGSRTNLIVPVWERAGGRQPAVERVEVPLGGASFLLQLQDRLEQMAQRYVVGQSMSANAQPTGIGNESAAEFQQDTKWQIVKSDAVRMAGTFTGNYKRPQANPGLIQFLHRWTFPQYYPHKGNRKGFPVWLEFNVPHPSPERYLGAASIYYNMGGELDMSEVATSVGFSVPGPGARILSMVESQKQMLQIQQQAAQQQQAMQQPPGGMPGQPGQQPGGQPGAGPEQGLLAGLQGGDSVYDEQPQRNGQPHGQGVMG